MERRKLFIALTILLLAIWGGSYLYKNKKTDQSLEKVRVAYALDYNSTQVFLDLAKEMKVFEKNGIELEEAASQKSAATTLIAGKADVAFGSVSTSLSEYLNDIDIIWVGSLFSNIPDVYYATKVTDASQKIRVGVSKRGGQAEFLSRLFLERLGWDKDNIEIIMAGEVNSRWAYMERDEIDATLVYPGEGLEIMKNKNNLKVYDYTEVVKDSSYPLGIYTTSKVMSQKEATLKKFMKALDEARNNISKNKEMIVGRLKDKYGLNDEIANDLYQNMVTVTEGSMAPEEDIISGKMKDLVVEIDKPSNKDRNLKGFISESIVPYSLF